MERKGCDSLGGTDVIVVDRSADREVEVGVDEKLMMLENVLYWFIRVTDRKQHYISGVADNGFQGRCYRIGMCVAGGARQ